MMLSLKRTFLLLSAVFLLAGNNGFSQNILPGVQAGYSYARASKLELGGNIYGTLKGRPYNMHVLGPYMSITQTFTQNSSYTGMQWGFNYHFIYDGLFAFRISPAYERNTSTDTRIGADAGISLLGLFVYGGYYYPIGKEENPGIARFRFGIRYVLNFSPVLTYY